MVEGGGSCRVDEVWILEFGVDVKHKGGDKI